MGNCRKNCNQDINYPECGKKDHHNKCCGCRKHVKRSCCHSRPLGEDWRHGGCCHNRPWERDWRYGGLVDENWLPREFEERDRWHKEHVHIDCIQCKNAYFTWIEVQDESHRRDGFL